ncbi:MAG: PHP domain-containing protein [Gemmataceae bacterium]|nr:PHP domain-containing protein [Gemmataceae bacterium]
MPAYQPFTALCQAISQPRTSGRADLHIHTVHSDGLYTPVEVIDLARRSGLAAVAITDHDTLEGVAPARAAAVGTTVSVISGVEITAERDGKELHLLGYFVNAEDAALGTALERLRAHRVGRFWEMVERLRGCGVSLDDEELQAQAAAGVLGRRHLALMLVKSRRAGSVREAFTRYLGDRSRLNVPKLRLPVAEAIALVRGAGGVASWAHPTYDCTRDSLMALRDQGLGAVEANYPSFRQTRMRELRAWAVELGLAVTAGSDCHGPGHPSRAVGACSLTAGELEQVRSMAGDKVTR